MAPQRGHEGLISSVFTLNVTSSNSLFSTGATLKLVASAIGSTMRNNSAGLKSLGSTSTPGTSKQPARWPRT